MSTKSLLVLACSALLFAIACDNPPAASVDAGADTGGGGDDAGMEEGLLTLPGLDGEVEVIYDDRGIPHIYATTRHDLMVVEGYLMARDRFAQMEFLRRNVIGRLAEVAGSLSPDLVQTDEESLLLGYRRVGHAIYDSLPTDDITRITADDFVEGINLYIDRIETGEEDPVVRGAELFNVLLTQPGFGHWEPADIFALARFQAANLSYDASPEVRRSRDLSRVLAAFPTDATDPRLADRAGFFSDMYGEWPAFPVYSRDGFNDGTTMALLPPGPRPTPGVRWAPPTATLEGALGFLDRVEERTTFWFGDADTRGSNNWLVDGTLTASGNPILANDPHLSLVSPSVWWYVHLNTAREGGEDMIDAQGVAFAGLPGVVLGFNRDIAWGATTTGYDVTDVYLEEITGTCTDGDVVSGTVTFEGAEVAIGFFDEMIPVAGTTEPLNVRFPMVPHHGAFLPGSCAPVLDSGGTPVAGQFTAITVRYTGDEISNELAYFTGLLTASTVEEARTAQDAFRVGSQNFIVIDRSSIAWSTESRIPIRDPRAMTYAIDAEGVPSGYCPHMVLPGTGEYEWTGDLDARFVPHDTNPARHWIATANQDNVGVTDDGNPCNDAHYLGANFDYGWRQSRIVEGLEALATRGDITMEDMRALQASDRSRLGDQLRDPIVAILEDPRAAVPTLTDPEVARLADARARLMAWSYATPHGVGATDTAEVADSIATTIFNAMLTRIIPRALEDEMCRLEGNTAADCSTGGPTTQSARLVLWMMTDASRLFSYDAGLGESVLWDDLRTDAVVETKEEIMVRGALEGLDYLAGRLGDDVMQWRWGRLHTVRFETIIPTVPGAPDVLSIPATTDPMYPDGFPRHGDWGNVDPGNYGLWRPTSWSFGSGASQRLIVEMTADGPIAWNALPGGQSIDPDSPHKMDEALLWIANEQPPIAFDEADVIAHEERRLTIRP